MTESLLILFILHLIYPPRYFNEAIHSIRIHNIKSLIGTHVLNLDDRFGASELFLIHGPRESGKQLVFDAVALSLFTKHLNSKAEPKGTIQTLFHGS